MMRYLHQSDDISSPACLETIYASEFILPSGLTAVNSRYKKRRKILLVAAKKEINKFLNHTINFIDRATVLRGTTYWTIKIDKT